MIVATAGHIDHGKTSLIRALTGIETDTLREERERGISIDLGFAYWQRSPESRIGFVDVPGHERFVRNMLAGVSGIDAALLVVAADDGPMPQTLEHLQILDLLGVAHGVVAITKCDRVEPARVDAVDAQLAALLAPTLLRAAPRVPVSAVSGRGLDALGDALAALDRRVSRERLADRAFRLAVDRVFTLAGHGTVATGYVHDGEIGVGERVLAMPAAREARVRSIQSAGADLRAARAGARCALVLAGLDAHELARGDWLVGAGAAPPVTELHAQVVVLPGEPRALPDLAQVHLHHGTDATMARVKTLDHRPIEPDATAICRLRLDRPACALNGDRFILRDPSASRTIGGGRVLAPVFRNRDPAWVAQALPLLVDRDLDALLDALLAASSGELDVERIRRTYGVPPQAVLQRAASRDAVACGPEQRTIVAQRVLARIGDALIERLDAWHRERPDSAGLPPPQLRRAVAPEASIDVFAQALRGLVDAGRVRWRGPVVALPGHVPQLPRRDAELWERVLPRLTESTASPPSVRVLAEEMRLNLEDLRTLLKRKCRDGDAWMITESRFFPRASVSALAATAAELSAALAPDGWFKAAQYRDRIGTGRTLAIEILEFFDRIGVTIRRGELRRMRAGFDLIVGPGVPIPPAPERGRPG